MTLLIGGLIQRSGNQNSAAQNQRPTNGGSGIILTNARSAEPCWILNLAGLRCYGLRKWEKWHHNRIRFRQEIFELMNSLPRHSN